MKWFIYCMAREIRALWRPRDPWRSWVPEDEAQIAATEWGDPSYIERWYASLTPEERAAHDKEVEDQVDADLSDLRAATSPAVPTEKTTDVKEKI